MISPVSSQGTLPVSHSLPSRNILAPVLAMLLSNQLLNTLFPLPGLFYANLHRWGLLPI